MLRIANVFPVPVPATMPNPLPEPAKRRMSAPCSRSSSVSIVNPSASSIVSHAARVGAITMTRPVAGSAARNACGSGEGSGRGRFALLEYRREASVFRRLPVAFQL